MNILYKQYGLDIIIYISHNLIIAFCICWLLDWKYSVYFDWIL